MDQKKKIVWYKRRGMSRLIPGVILVSFIVLATLLSFIWTPYDPNLSELCKIGVAPLSYDIEGNFHLFGTDQLGRDMLSRVMVGGQLALLIAFLSVLCSAAIGTILGVISGYNRGWVDNLTGIILEIQHSIPMILIIILFITVLGSSVWVLAGGLALSEWYVIFRQARAKTLVHSKADYILAAKVLGATRARIIFKHLIPNVLPSVMVLATLLIATIILAEAGLSFLGLGVARPYATWGRMVADGQSSMATTWWISTTPAIFITCLVIGINLIGDGVRRILRME